MAYRSLRRQTLHYFARPAIGPCREPVNSPAAWRGEAVRAAGDWIERFSDAELGEIEQALDRAEAGGRPLARMRAADLPLPTVASRIAGWREQIANGRGFVLIRGLPVSDWSEQRAQRFFWGFGQHFGEPGAQNPDGDLLGHVRNIDSSADERFYRTDKAIAVHTDAADVVGLMCLQPARQGGLSRIASSVTVFNALRRRHPALTDRLFEPMWFDTHGDGGIPAYPIEPCAWDGRTLRTFWQSDYFRSAPQFGHVPPLSDDEHTLLDAWDEIANDPDHCLDMDLQAGDIQLLSNHTQLHARTGFTDWDTRERRRHLLRLWLSLPQPESLTDRWRRTRAHARVVGRAARELIRTRIAA